MLEPLTKYTSLIYGLIFLAMSLTLLWKTRKTITSPFRNIFWAFTAFSAMKTTSILSGLSIGFLPSDGMQLLNNMPLVVTISTLSSLSIMSSGISNVFLFHFGISILIYKTSVRIDYKVFPVILFMLYMILYFSGIIEPRDVEKISRYSFGLNGAFLGGIGCFNLFKIKKTSGKNNSLSGLITYGFALLFYSFTEGIITNPVLGFQVEVLRIFSAIILFITSLFAIDLLKKEKGNRIGFI